MNAYFEVLFELLESNQQVCMDMIDTLLAEEIRRRTFRGMEGERLTAYREACRAFVAERLESYNPIGVQYRLFDQTSTKEAFELEQQLDWYDSRAEFEALVEGARARAAPGLSGEMLRERAAELIREHGAYPNGSIIAEYEAAPTPNKLPDYVVARVIEAVVR